MDLELADRVHRNLMEVSSWMGEERGGATRRSPEGLLFSGASTMPFLNGAMRERGAPGEAAELLAAAREFFFARERGYVAYAWPGDPELEQAAAEAGMDVVMERYPEMACRGPLEELGRDLRPVEDERAAREYWQICDEAYPSLGFPPSFFSEAFEPSELLAERVRGWLAYEGERAVACASLWLAEGVGMVGWVAARPEVRGAGHAAACTVRVTNQAFELGAELASLQASAMGEPIYARLGYEEVFCYRLYGAMPL